MEVVAAGLVATDVGAGTYGFGVVDVAGCTLDTVVVLEGAGRAGVDRDGVGAELFRRVGRLRGGRGRGGTPGHTVSWSGDVALTLGTSIVGLGRWRRTRRPQRTPMGAPRSTAFVLTEPEALEVALSANPVGCSWRNDGAVMAELTGGTPEWTVSWTGSTRTRWGGHPD